MNILHREGSVEHLLVISAIVLSTLVLAFRPAWILESGMRCGMQMFLGLKCPFCGMTRDFSAILHGQPATQNPCSWFAFVVVYLIYPVLLLGAVSTGRLRIFYGKRMHQMIAVGLLAMAILNNLN